MTYQELVELGKKAGGGFMHTDKGVEVFCFYPLGLVEFFHSIVREQSQTHMTVQEVWEAAGGNAGIKATKADVLLALKTLDEICDETSAEEDELNHD